MPKDNEVPKKRTKILRWSKKSVPLHTQLSNGVMVAQQVLVLFVVVRIRLGQQKNRAGITSRTVFYFSF